MANAARDAELAAARAHLAQLREDRAAELAAAAAAHKAETDRLRAANDLLEDEMDELGTHIETMVTGLAMTLPPKAFFAGQKSMRELQLGFKSRFPAVSAKLNNMMTQLANSMNRTSTIVVTTVHRTVFEGEHRAMGGPIVANRAYIVGERGPEMFVPNISGSIIPNHDLGNTPSMDKTRFRASGMTMGGGGGGGGNVLTINVNVPVSANKSEIGREIVEAINQFERVSGTSWRG